MKPLTRWLALGAGVAGASYATYVATTWLRYGRPPRAQGDALDPLLDSILPTYDVCERHHLALAAPAEVTFAAAKVMELDRSRIVRAIFKGRELILRGRPDTTPQPTGLVDEMTAIGWRVLAERPDELVMGAVTKPWQANPVFRSLSPEAFASFTEPDHVKIAWTLRVVPSPDGGSVFHTETRAIATDARARTKFRAYWAFLSPGIVVIRRALLGALKAEVERTWRVEGDDLVPDATPITHAVTIAAPPRDVWPWLVQMGCQRGGWYSWDILDNAGIRSADHIIPELQHLAIGDVLPWRPNHPEGFKVARVVPEHALVLESSNPAWDGSWAFVLEPLGTDRTRLISRYRVGKPPRPRDARMLPALVRLHDFMERKQLQTIKHHAEHLHAG